MPWRDRQPVEAPAPTVPRGDQRTDQDTIELSDQQRLGVGSHQSGQSVEGVSDAGQAARRGPQVEHELDVLLAGAAEVRLLQAMELPVVNQIANATFSQLLLKLTAEQVDAEAFAPGPVARAHLRRALAINMKRGNLEAWAGESLVALNVIDAVNRGLRSIVTPTVVIEGVHDNFVKPQCATQLAATLPHARLEMVSGGHMAPYTHPTTIAAAVEALSRQSTQQSKRASVDLRARALTKAKGALPSVQKARRRLG